MSLSLKQVQELSKQQFKVSLFRAGDIKEVLCDSNVIILDVFHKNMRPERVIPGSLIIDMAEIENGWTDEEGNLKMVYRNCNIKPPKVLRSVFEGLGIDIGTRVVVCSQCTREGSFDILPAARMVWTLCYMGVKDVALLDCDCSTLQIPMIHVAGSSVDEQCDTSSKDSRVDFFLGCSSLSAPLHPEMLTTTEDVEEYYSLGRIVTMLPAGKDNKPVILADTRSWNEFAGIEHKYPFDIGLGRLPQALWANWGSSTYVGEQFYSNDMKKVRGVSQVFASWQQQGLFSSSTKLLNILADERFIDQDDGAWRVFYCGSGWRSSFAWVICQIAGFRNCSNYDGGWLEWNRLHPKAPMNNLIG